MENLKPVHFQMVLILAVAGITGVLGGATYTLHRALDLKADVELNTRHRIEQEVKEELIAEGRLIGG